MRPGDHVTPALRKLHWLPSVTARIKYKLCLLAHKVTCQSNAEVHRCRPPDTGRRNVFSICIPRVSSQRFRSPEAKSDKCSAVAEMGDRLATIDMGRNSRLLCPFLGIQNVGSRSQLQGTSTDVEWPVIASLIRCHLIRS